MEDSSSSSSSSGAQSLSQNFSANEDRTATSDLPPHSSKLENHVIFSSHSNVTPAGSNHSARYKLMSPAKLPISRPATCINVPPGLSPTSFLESPVLLSNIKVEPSPTTGSLFKPQLMRGSGGYFSLPSNCTNSKTFDDGTSDSFGIKPKSISSHPGLLSAGPVVSLGMNHQHSKLFIPVEGECQSQSFESSPLIKSKMAVRSKESSLSAHNVFASGAGVHAGVDSDESNQRMLSYTGVQASESDRKDAAPSSTAERSSDDGYNWRKYGQKVVKGSEFPRSYYKCTHPNCEVKKIFERSHDGQITEIVYKGTHDHPKPQPTRRYGGSCVMPFQEDKTSQEDKSNIEASCNLEPSCPPEPYLQKVNNNGTEHSLSQFNIVDDVDEDDPFSKRRKMDVGGLDVIPVVKPIREPRVVVQTVSEVDILDDGYRWRKYGQKVVRGNPNPRSYYKCTNVGCSVRKHVERASHDPKAVITTYEGKHIHDVPTTTTTTRTSSGHEAAGVTTSSPVNGMTRVRSEGDRISLDLGVGIQFGSENRNDEPQQTLNVESEQRSVRETVPPMYYGSVSGNGVLYATRENCVEGSLSLDAPLNYPAGASYSQNLGRIVLGP